MTITNEIQHLSNLIAGKKVGLMESFEERLEVAILTVTGYGMNMIRKRTRQREIVQVRQLYQTMLKENTSLSLTEIGERSGGYDHATILYSVKTIKDLLDVNNKEIKSYYSGLENCLFEI